MKKGLRSKFDAEGNKSTMSATQISTQIETSFHRRDT